MSRRKSNLRKIPELIIEKAIALTDVELSVGCTLQVSQTDLANGVYTHLGFQLREGHLVVPTLIEPPATQGRYSRRNLKGFWIVHRDKSKIIKWFELRAPTHTVDYTRLVFSKTLCPPENLTFTPNVLGCDEKDEPVWTVSILASRKLKKDSPHFRQQLLVWLNLIQENVGCGTVYSANPTIAEVTESRTVDWELLPEGIREDALLNRLLPKDPARRMETIHRLDVRRKLLESQHPKRWVIGSSGLRRYFGAQFQDDLVAMENLDYGNALYVIKGPWENLSKLSRFELSKNSTNVARIVHSPGWEDKALAAIERFKGGTLQFGE